VPHIHLERLGGDASVGEPLCTATAKIVGTRKLWHGLAVFCDSPHDVARLLSDRSGDFSNVLGRQPVF
jgi:hypothetical protein